MCPPQAAYTIDTVNRMLADNDTNEISIRNVPCALVYAPVVAVDKSRFLIVLQATLQEEGDSVHHRLLETEDKYQSSEQLHNQIHSVVGDLLLVPPPREMNERFS